LLFSGINFLDKKNVPARIPEDSFFSCVFRRNFSQELGFGEVAGIPVFFSLSQEFFAGIPVGRNSCGQEFLYLSRNPPDSGGFRRIPEDSGGFRRIPEDSGGFLFPPKAAGSGQRIKKALC
jgi:hypothetical protein